MKLGNYPRYLKAIVGVIGAVITGLQQAFPGAHWVSMVTLAATPVLVFLVPNAAPAVPAPVAPVQAPPPVPADPPRM